MSNFIRAVFYVDRMIHIEQLQHLVNTLHTIGCYPASSTLFALGESFEQDGYHVVKIPYQDTDDMTPSLQELRPYLEQDTQFAINFDWEIGNKNCLVYLRKLGGWKCLIIDIADDAFYIIDQENINNATYKHRFTLLVALLDIVIDAIKPVLGYIGHEIDMNDNDHFSDTVITWGMYLSNHSMNGWSFLDNLRMQRLQSSLQRIPASGGEFLFFHPLRFYTDFTKQRILQKIIQRNAHRILPK